jgi:XRE family transcriptional regulator, master regulator for biofilm formation
MEKLAEVLRVELKSLLKLAGETDSKQQVEKEWVDFIQELKNAGVEKDSIHEYKIVIEFMKWYNEKKG